MLLAEEPFKEPYKDYTIGCGKKGGRLVLSVTSDPKSFNPIVAQETSTTQITSLIFEGLTRTDPRTLEVLPNLAERWQTSDGKEWLFYLRNDVYWNDGKKFTASDVLFTFNELIYNPDIPTSSKDIFTIEGKRIEVEKVDNYTVKFKLPFTFAPFLRALSQEVLPAHRYSVAVSDKKFTFSMNLDSDPCDIVGTGPFRLKKYLPGEKVILERNPFYWKKGACGDRLPYLENVVYIILPNSDTALLKFLEGEIDYYTLRPQDVGLLGPRQNRDNFTIYNAGPSFGSNFLVFNQNPGINPYTNESFVKPYKLKWFRNRKFRQAVSYAINRDKIVNIVMNGLGLAQYSSLSPANTFFYTDDIKKYPYSPDKAREYLSQMGFKDENEDGILEDAGGNKLEVNFFTNADNTQRVQISTLIKKDLEEVGIKVSFLPLDFNNLVSKLTATFDWEVILIGLTGGIEPYFGKNVWSYRGTLHMWNPTGKPLDSYEEEIEVIFNESVKTLQEEKRKELFYRWQKIISEEVPFIYTIVAYSIYGIRNKFGNLYPTGFGGAFSEIESIFIDAD